MPSRITLDQLLAHGACQPQVALFRKHFPTGSALVTPAACLALASVFDFGWAANNLLTGTARTQYDAARSTARTQYDAARSTARAQYAAACDTAWAQYDAARSTAGAQYDAARSTAQTQYQAAVAPTLAQYQAAVAVAFADAYLSQP